MIPPATTILQERLGIERCAEMEIHSNCSGTGNRAQVAYDALRTGCYGSALVVYTQLSSLYLRNCCFNQPQMTKTQAALRYILAADAERYSLRPATIAHPSTSFPARTSSRSAASACRA